MIKCRIRSCLQALVIQGKLGSRARIHTGLVSSFCARLGLAPSSTIWRQDPIPQVAPYQFGGLSLVSESWPQALAISELAAEENLGIHFLRIVISGCLDFCVFIWFQCGHFDTMATGDAMAILQAW